MGINDDFLDLLNRISIGEATEEDLRVYNQWCKAFEERDLPVPSFEETERKILKGIQKRIKRRSTVHGLRKVWPKIAVAASLVLMIIGAYYLWNKPKVKQTVSRQSLDIGPGSNRAVLTLANGQNINLDPSATGKISIQGNRILVRKDSSMLSYQGQRRNAAVHENVLMNRLTVPKGGQYQLVLSDGTKVWLNSASSIQYPVFFAGKKRKVYVTGEVYMEVTQDAHHPFVVVSDHVDITVLGTRFNLMAYPNEPVVKATLLQGSIKVAVPERDGMAKIIQPNEQAVVGKTEQEIRVDHIDATEVAAWIHGYLSLENYTVKELMNQIARWYNVTVIYEGVMPEKQFGGLVNRNAHLSDVLAILGKAGILTRMEGRQIVVLGAEKTTE